MLQEFFNLLDLPGSSVRDLVGGENPFDQWASPLSGEHRLSGAQLVSRYTGASPDSWGSTLAGFGAEMFLDPTNLIGGLGILKKALAARKLNALGNWTDGGRVFAADARPAGRYGYVNPKAVEAELITDPIRSSPLREDFGQRRIPQLESEHETFWHGTGKDWPSEPDFPLGRPRADKLLTGTGGAREGPGLYTAQRHSIGQHYFDMLSNKAPKPSMPDISMDRVVQRWARNVLQKADPEDPRLYSLVFPSWAAGGQVFRGPEKLNIRDPRAVLDKAILLKREIPSEKLEAVRAAKDRIIQLRDKLIQKLNVPVNATSMDYLDAIRLTDETVDRQRLVSDVYAMDHAGWEYQDLLDDINKTSPLNAPEAIKRRQQTLHDRYLSDNPYARTGGLYELAVPKKKLDKFMYGDEPLEESVRHIPEAKDFPVAVRDVTPPDAFGYPDTSGSNAVYWGDNRRNIIRKIAENFGIENPTGADAQRILTETFGISGNKYLDAASRTSNDTPTYNHVIWDPEILENIRVRSVTKIGSRGEPVVLKEPFNRMLQGGRSRATVSSSPLNPVDNWQSGTQVNQLPPTWSPGTERLLNRKAAATLALYNMAARQGGYTVE